MVKLARKCTFMAAFFALSVALPAGATADEHLVSPAQMSGRLREAVAESVRVDRPPSTAEPLSAQEREDLERRAAELTHDPAAAGAGHFVAGVAVGAVLGAAVIVFLMLSDANY